MQDLKSALEQARSLYHLLMSFAEVPVDEDWASPAAAPTDGQPIEVEVRGSAFYFPDEGVFKGLHGVIAWRTVQK